MIWALVVFCLECDRKFDLTSRRCNNRRIYTTHIAGVPLGGASVNIGGATGGTFQDGGGSAGLREGVFKEEECGNEGGSREGLVQIVD